MFRLFRRSSGTVAKTKEDMIDVANRTAGELYPVGSQKFLDIARRVEKLSMDRLSKSKKLGAQIVGDLMFYRDRPHILFQKWSDINVAAIKKPSHDYHLTLALNHAIIGDLISNNDEYRALSAINRPKVATVAGTLGDRVRDAIGLMRQKSSACLAMISQDSSEIETQYSALETDVARQAQIVGDAFREVRKELLEASNRGETISVSVDLVGRFEEQFRNCLPNFRNCSPAKGQQGLVDRSRVLDQAGGNLRDLLGRLDRGVLSPLGAIGGNVEARRNEIEAERLLEVLESAGFERRQVIAIGERLGTDVAGFLSRRQLEADQARADALARDSANAEASAAEQARLQREAEAQAREDARQREVRRQQQEEATQRANEARAARQREEEARQADSQARREAQAREDARQAENRFATQQILAALVGILEAMQNGAQPGANQRSWAGGENVRDAEYTVRLQDTTPRVQRLPYSESTLDTPPFPGRDVRVRPQQFSPPAIIGFTPEARGAIVAQQVVEFKAAFNALADAVNADGASVEQVRPVAARLDSVISDMASSLSTNPATQGLWRAIFDFGSSVTQLDTLAKGADVIHNFRLWCGNLAGSLIASLRRPQDSNPNPSDDDNRPTA